jgi:hypothetical protein
MEISTYEYHKIVLDTLLGNCTLQSRDHMDHPEDIDTAAYIHCRKILFCMLELATPVKKRNRIKTTFITPRNT